MNPSECKFLNLEALKRFMKDAQIELKKADFKGLEISLKQAYGRVKNITMIEENENAL